MSSMKKILIIMLISAITINGNGCAKRESMPDSEISMQTVADNTDIANSESNTPTAAFEPVPVPKNGWTIEELAKTIRINGIPISYPFTIGSLSDDYRFVDPNRVLIADPVNSGFIEYKGALIVGVGLERNSQIDDNYEKKVIRFITFDDYEYPEYNNAFTINGIGYGASPEDVEKALGLPDKINSDLGFYKYYEEGYEEDNDKGFLTIGFYNEELYIMDFILEKNVNK
ncbi:MAG: hypothetical protein NC320_04945 [Clostridium sp.]|nr:hypothetical protein [Clostridium sp.]MCM1547331.1 hypothetical protein [Ruminococcus sp.]